MTFWTRMALCIAGAGALGAAAVACGKSGDSAGKGGGSAVAPAPEPALPALSVPALGAEQLRRFNYLYGDGAAAHDKAVAAHKAKERDWAAVRTHAEAALAKDAFHLDAHRLLAAALAQDGDYSGAAAHLLTALAGDWLRFGAAVAKDPDFAVFWGSPVGKQLAESAKTIAAEHLRRGQAGLWLVGRRSAFRLPAKAGTQTLSSRGELYAYDRELGRFLRLSETDHTVVGFVRSPSRREIALIGYDKVEFPADGAGAGIDSKKPALLARPWALTLDATTLLPLGKRATLPKGRQVTVAYGPGEQLLAATAPADGRWNLGAESWVAIDRTTGKTTKTQPPQAAQIEAKISITLEDGEVESPVPGVTVADGEAEVSSILVTALGGAAASELRIPESGKAQRRSISVSPAGAHIAFATAADPCSTDAAPSLYVADAKTGALRHVLTGRSRFASRWLDEATLAYDDPDGMVRLWDVGTGRELARLSEKAGLSLAVLAMSPAPLCKTAPPEAETAPDGATDESPEQPVVAPTP
ncbi:MAG: hypothetical protein IPI49_24590 [Myxococcales bacterium]|nr:hypothetical protein [Myxococcales bacterium]